MAQLGSNILVAQVEWLTLAILALANNIDQRDTFGYWGSPRGCSISLFTDVLIRGSGSRVDKPTSVTMPWTGMWRQASVTKLLSFGKGMMLAWMLH